MYNILHSPLVYACEYSCYLFSQLVLHFHANINLSLLSWYYFILSRHSFARFGASLVVLDLHESGIQTCDAQAFIGLTKLEKLMLWGNKLIFVPGNWFVNMYSLKTLDLSFNFIESIDYMVFQMLPSLENFYFDYNQLRYIDYNMFAYLGNLKKVKFSKNPWNWS